MGVIDNAGAVREGESLDTDAVDAWLKGQVPSLTGRPAVSQYSGGASNWTYRLKYPERDFVLRRPPAGTKAASAHDMMREFTIQWLLKPAFPLVPRMVAACQDPSVLGCDFYVMERIEGIIPRANLPRGVDLDQHRVRQLCQSMLDALIDLHAVDPQATGLDRFGKGQGYCMRQVTGWERRYCNARTRNVPSFRRVRAWLKDHTPEDVTACVIHNDWRFDNLVLAADDPTCILGVLDWELATVGDPLMELGSMLAYWVESGDNFLMRATRRQPTHLPGMLRRREVVDYYLGKTGLRCDNWPFYEVFGLFRLAGIAQQIYYRYHHRQTRNPAFRHFWVLINYFDWRCRRIIRKAGR
ncbi:MAG: phosphotransferase family protein [Pseudomonadota bacterium]|nr:MAG: phosphotransferase family protein [Pseudomonadota bacterium]